MHRIEDFLSSGWSFRLLNLVKQSPFLARLAWRTLRLYQNATGAAPDEHAQLRAMEPATAPSPDGRRVLIFSLRGWTAHLAWETTLARALHLRGAQTLTVVCDRVLPACEPRTSLDDFDSTCERCASQSSRFLSAAGLPHRWLGEFVAPEEIAAFRQQTADLSLPALQSFTAGSLPIGELVGASVNRHLLRGQIEPIPEHLAAYRRFVTAGLTIQAASNRILDAFQPEAILLMNGLFYAEAVLMAIARARGIPVWSYERGKKTNALIFAQNTSVVKKQFDEEWHDLADRPLTSDQDAALDAYFQVRAGGNVGIERLWPDVQASSEDNVMADDRPTAVLFTNVLWDTAVYNSDLGFESMAEWVTHTAQRFAANPDRRLIIRVHPAEIRVPFKTSRDPLAARLYEAIPQLPANVQVIPPDDSFSSYALMDLADVVLVYTSTVGLEAAVRGVPTIVAGKTHYRGKGFTLDPATPQAYDAAIEEAFARRQMTGTEIQLARRYAYLFFFREIIPFKFVREGPRSYVTFHYHQNEDLRPSKEPALDAICDSLLTGRPLVNPFAR